jgi:hypothetical protein
MNGGQKTSLLHHIRMAAALMAILFLLFFPYLFSKKAKEDFLKKKIKKRKKVAMHVDFAFLSIVYRHFNVQAWLCSIN